MVAPSQKRRAVEQVVATGTCSQRRACRLLELRRSSCRYEPGALTPRREREEVRIIALSQAHPRYGYRRVHTLLGREGLRPSLRRVQRIRRRERLRVMGPARRPKRQASADAKVSAQSRNDVWCFDFVFDSTAHGSTLKMLTILDEYTRYCIAIVVGHRLNSASVVEALSDAVLKHGTPRHVRCDNGSEFIAARLQCWLRQAQIGSRFIEPGRPWQNGHNESFNGKMRDECLEREVFANLLEARSVTAVWREEYNTFRPHRSLGQLTPAQYQLSGRPPGSLRSDIAQSPQPN